jgi:hypothetical protein
MRHPELLFLAMDRCHVRLHKLIYDAFDRKRLFISARTLCALHDKFMRCGDVPEFVEDYALDLLAKHEKETKLPNSYQEWLTVRLR